MRIHDTVLYAFLEINITIADGTGNIKEPNLDTKKNYIKS